MQWAIDSADASELAQYSKDMSQLVKYRQQLLARVDRMQCPSEITKQKYRGRVAASIGACSRTVQRVTQLSQEPIKFRVQLTWQSFDRAQWVAVKGSDEQLAAHIVSPELWRSQLPNTVLGVLGPCTSMAHAQWATVSTRR